MQHDMPIVNNQFVDSDYELIPDFLELTIH